MYPIALIAFAVIPLIVLVIALGVSPGRARAAVIASTFAIAVGANAATIGLGGSVQSMITTLQGVAHVHPDDRSIILAAGESEAAVARTFGALVGAPAIAVGAAVLWIRRPRRKGAPA